MSADQIDGHPITGIGEQHLAEGMFEIHSGRIRRNPDGTGDMTTTVRRRGSRKKQREDGAALVNASGWLLVLLAAGVLAVSYAAQAVFIYRVRHQVIASNIEAGMFDVGMIIFAMLGLGQAFKKQSARVERALVVVCAFGSAAMNYAAATVGSPRSVLVYVAPPLFLALVTDRVIAVVRRHRLGAQADSSPWQPVGRAALTLAKGAGLAALYTLRWCLDTRETWRGIRQIILNAAPLPPGPDLAELPPGASKKAILIAAYQAHPDHGDRAKASQVAKTLAPHAGLGWSTARTYIGAYLDELEAAAT